MKETYWLFRYRSSSRGTDVRICAKMKKGTTIGDAIEVARAWAYDATSGSACHEYTVSVRKVKPIGRREWLRKWDKVCKAYEKIKGQRDDLRAIGSPRDFTHR